MIDIVKTKVGGLLEKTGMKSTYLHVLNYLSISFATQGLAFISIPIFTRLLSPADYGFINVFSAYAQIGMTLFTLNLMVGIGRYYFENKPDFGQYLFTAVMLPILLLFFFGLSIFFYGDYIASLLGLPRQMVPFIVPSATFLFIIGLVKIVFRPQMKSNIIRNFSIAQSYSGFILMVVIVYLLPENKYMGKLYAEIVLLVIFGFFIFKKVWPLMVPKFNINHLKYSFSYGMPLIPAYMSGLILSQFDRVMINNYVGPTEAGLYSFAYNIGMLPIILSNALNDSWTPTYYKLMNAKSYQQHDKEVVNLFGLFAAGVCFLILFGPEIGRLLGSKSFHASLELIPIIMVGQVFLAISPIYKRHISFVKKTYWTSIIILSAGVLNIFLNAWFIPKYGAVAGAYTTLVCYVFQAILTYLVVKYVLKFHTTNPLQFMTGLSSIILTILFYYMMKTSQLFWVETILIKLVFIGGIGFLFYRKEIRKFIQ